MDYSAKVSEKQGFGADYGRAVSFLARGLAHEVRNPLALAKAHIELLESGLSGRQDAGDAAKRYMLIRKELDRINAIMEEFIAYSAEAPAKREPFAPLPEIRRAVESFAAAYADIEFAFVGEDNSVEISGDISRFGRLMDNLLKNAVEAVYEARSAEGAITVTAAAANGKLTIRVTDNGIGFQTENTEKLLLPFYTTKKGGTGLGLHQCAQTAADFGGCLSLEPNKNTEGAAAALEIPL